MGNKTSALNVGAVVSVRGSFVDVRFGAHLPPIYSLLRARDGEIVDGRPHLVLSRDLLDLRDGFLHTRNRRP